MRRWLRLLPLLITAFWLPLQAVAAVAMPYCHHAAGQAVADPASMEEHCHEQHGQKDGPASAGTAVDQDCDGCGFCHLASTTYIPLHLPTAGRLAAADDFVAQPLPVPAGQIPEPPQHPPRRSN